MEQISFFSLLEKPTKKNSFNCFIYKDIHVFITRKAYQRSLKLSVGKNARLQINCSLSTSLKEITTFLEEYWIWIQKQIYKQKKLIKKYPPKKFKEGENFLFQGQIFILKYTFLKNQNLNKAGFHFLYSKKILIYYWKKPNDLNSNVLKKELISFYKQAGEKVLHKSVYHYSSLMQLFPKSVRISSAKSLWGSCSNAKSLSLNWRLVAAPPSVLNYLVIHELAHLKYLNHSPDFWSLVSHFCPKYKEQEDWLKKNAYAMDFLLPQSELHPSSF